MSTILDRGSLFFACTAALIANALINTALSLGYVMPFFVLAAFYVPGVLVTGALVGGLGSAGMVVRRDYAPMLTCAAMAFAAVGVPFAILLRAAPLPIALSIAGIYFMLLMFFAVRTVFGVGNGTRSASLCSRGFRSRGPPCYGRWSAALFISSRLRFSS